MATNRTATAHWKKIRDTRRQIDFDNGLTNCPLCKVPLDWEYSRRPNSAEVDHIIEWAKGGKDELNNTRVICRHCNQSRGGKTGAKQNRKAKAKPISLTTNIEW